MSRNGNGQYSLPQSPFAPNTPISSAAVNSNNSDIADALTGSLARDGQGGMTAVLPLANAGFNYLSDPNTGLRRTAADAQALQVGGVDWVFTPTGLAIPAGATITSSDGSDPGFVVGVPYPWMGSAAPTGCVLLYGQAISRTNFPRLFGIVGTTYGSGDGSTTFNLPDMRGVAPGGKVDMGGTNRGNLTGATTLGGTLGTQTRTLAATNLPAHSHGISIQSGGQSSSHNHTVPDVGGLTLKNFQGGGSFSGYIFDPSTGTTTTNSASNDHSHLVVGSTDNGPGASTPVSVVQPTIIFNWITRAA